MSFTVAVKKKSWANTIWAGMNYLPLSKCLVASVSRLRAWLCQLWQKMPNWPVTSMSPFSISMKSNLKFVTTNGAIFARIASIPFYRWKGAGFVKWFALGRLFLWPGNRYWWGDFIGWGSRSCLSLWRFLGKWEHSWPWVRQVPVGNQFCLSGPRARNCLPSPTVLLDAKVLERKKGLWPISSEQKTLWTSW